MGTYKKKMEALLQKGKLRKDQCLILVLGGILLCVIALPVDNQKSGLGFSKSGLSNSTNGTVTESTDAVKASSYSVDGVEEYGTYWEKELAESLSNIEGAGKVQVLITLKESEGKVVEKDGKEQRTDTGEQDAAGGTRNVTDSMIEKSTIYTTDSRGENVPYVIKTTAPVVSGVVVITQGADNLMVRENIIDAIQVLFDMDTNNIRVVKMKTKNQ